MHDKTNNSTVFAISLNTFSLSTDKVIDLPPQKSHYTEQNLTPFRNNLLLKDMKTQAYLMFGFFAYKIFSQTLILFSYPTDAKLKW